MCAIRQEELALAERLLADGAATVSFKPDSKQVPLVWQVLIYSKVFTRRTGVCTKEFYELVCSQRPCSS